MKKMRCPECGDSRVRREESLEPIKGGRMLPQPIHECLECGAAFIIPRRCGTRIVEDGVVPVDCEIRRLLTADD